MEAKRQFDVLNRRLAESEYVAGPDYTIADIAIWPWYGGVALDRTYEGADEFLAAHEYEHVMRWAMQIDERPAVKRGRIVNKMTGEPSSSSTSVMTRATSTLSTQDKLQRGRRDVAKPIKDDAI